MNNIDIVKKLIDKKISITTMESCTGGFLISSITDVEGASNITDGGFVTYSNKQKIVIGVPEEIIKKYGVYSLETATEMAKVCQRKMCSNIGIGVTGTLSNIDINNKDSIQGEVYYSIKYNERIIVSKRINVPMDTRHEQKKFIINRIFEDIDKFI